MIDIKNLNKSLGGKTLFEDLNVHIESGEFVVFCGESGCGKTTLLNMIGGIERPDSGVISLDGTDIWKLKSRRKLFLYKYGFLFQNFALLEDETVKKNLSIISKRARTDMSIPEALERVGIADKLDTEVFKLSGGEQQRVALARLMLKKCDTILADEPTGSLDERNAEDVLKILHSLCDRGKTVIIVTHSPKIIESERRVIRL